MPRSRTWGGRFGPWADFDGDGKTDRLWQNQVTGDLYAWLRDGTVVKGAPNRQADLSWQVVPR